jgi:hypothetical protein
VRANLHDAGAIKQMIWSASRTALNRWDIRVITDGL